MAFVYEMEYDEGVLEYYDQSSCKLVSDNLVTSMDSDGGATEAAKRLEVTSQTITRWVEAGKFPGAFKANPSIRTFSYLIPVKSVENVEKSKKG